MSPNPLKAKIAAPYARALYEYGLTTNVMHKVTADLFNINEFITRTPELESYLKNPGISTTAKYEVLEKTVKSKVNKETFNFVGVLVHRDRLDILEAVAIHYSRLVYESAGIRLIDVVTPIPMGLFQRNKLTDRLKKLTKAREVRLTLYIDPTLIGGILIKTDSKVLDYTVKNKIQSLAKYLDATLEI
jgi:F-type H+-transporting ATPase subunit delta